MNARGDDALLTTDSAESVPSQGVTSESSRGESVGRYVLIDRLGSGGMGVVYAAYDPELDRKVALKLLHGPPPTSEGTDRARAKVMNALFGDPTPPDQSATAPDQSRLKREAQAAARINHPNVVTIHDVGEHRGRVFVAMEYVRGTTLGTWANAQSRPWAAAVDVLAQAAEGLSAAHLEGLVHRDFKPDNVMIDESGRVRVMDFGLVRAESITSTADDLRPRDDALGVSLTREGAVMGTPAYMSPEQFLGLQAGPASDQFSFCVTAWELLYGERPFAGDTIPQLVASVTASRRRAPPPSVNVPEHIRRVLDRGLEADPADRYRSMSELRRALTPDRSRRWRGLTVAVVAAAGLSIYGARQLEEQRQVAACEREGGSIREIWGDAAREQMKAGMIATGIPFAAGSFERTQPWLDRYAEQWTASRVDACLDGLRGAELAPAAIECLDDRARGLSDLVGSLSEPSGDTLRDAVISATRLPEISTCSERTHLERRETLPLDPKEREQVVVLRQRLARAQALHREGRFDDGLVEIEGAAELADEAERQRLAGRLRYVEGMLHHETGNYDAAEATLTEAVVSLARIGADPMAAEAATGLALLVTTRQSRPAEGAIWAQWAQTLLDRAGIEDELRVAELEKELGLAAEGRGAYDEAIARYGHSLELTERLLGPDHPRVAVALNNLGSIHSEVGHSKQAIELYERALGISRATLGDDHPSTARPLNNIAKIHWRRGEMGKARDAMARSLAIQEAALGLDHPQVGVSVGNLGIVIRGIDGPAAAQPLHERAVDILERALSPTHPMLGRAWKNLGDTQQKLDAVEDAGKSHARALTILEQGLGSEHIEVANLCTNIAIGHTKRGEHDEALTLLERARDIYLKSVGDAHPDFGLVLLEIGRNEVDRGRFERAIEPLERAVKILDANDTDPALRGRARFLNARALLESGRARERGLAIAREARLQLESAEEPPEDILAEVDAWLASPPAPRPELDSSAG